MPELVIGYTPETIEEAEAGHMAYQPGLVHVTLKTKPTYEGNYVYTWKKREGQWGVTLYI